MLGLALSSQPNKCQKVHLREIKSLVSQKPAAEGFLFLPLEEEQMAVVFPEQPYVFSKEFCSKAFPWKGISAARLQSRSPAGFAGLKSFEGGNAEGSWLPTPQHTHDPPI